MRLPFSLGRDLSRALARSSHAAGQILDPVLAPEPGGPRPDWTSVFEAAHRAAGIRDSLLVTIDDFQWIARALGWVHPKRHSSWRGPMMRARTSRARAVRAATT